MRFQHYDDAGIAYGLTPRQVQAIVKRHALTKRKIYGQMAVDSDAFEKAAEGDGYKLLPGWTRVRQAA
jgi:hypothetical protein